MKRCAGHFMVRALQVLGRGFGLSRAGAAHNTLRRGRGG